MNISFENINSFTYLAVYGAGVLTSLTPCVYPIIPIVVGFLGSQKGSTRQKLLAALSYVSGLSLVYASLGMIAALSGSMFGALSVNPFVYLGFGVLLLALGGNMMDWYVLPMPSFNPRKSNNSSNFFGAFLFGMTSGLVASPCTAPVLAGLLVFVAAKKAVISGGLLMLTFALGLNTILLILGFFAGALSALPKSGGWMVLIKKALAFLIIAAGIYFVFKAGTLY
ncbi:MAG: sulfite exporter TauE/SafE family protein [Endomicrobiales bacterium]|nr:sulfite exporter TauE/SafE family protein [Endomicrobiales bacterium]